MNALASKRPFEPDSADAAGVVSWVHFGDLHMTRAGEQNHLDLAEIVNEINRAFSDSVSFVFLPGDVADDVREYDVRLIDMGHTHYNEIANDSRTLYSATRSTGQIEEGPVGYSVTNLDGKVVSWRFVDLGKLPVAVITSPSDERLLTKSSEMPRETLKVRANFWGEVEAEEATAHLDGQAYPMKRVGDSQVWEADLPTPREGTHPLKVSFKDARGKIAVDEIRFAVGVRTERKSEERDQDNALEAWPEHGLLGTQLGPNKNGKKW